MADEKKPAEEVTPPVTPPTPEELEREAAFKWLDRAAPEDILRHARVGGIFGQRLQVREQVIRQEEAAKAMETARREAELENERLANDDPAEFSRKYLTDKEKERQFQKQQQVLEALEGEYAAGIGNAFKELAEFQNLTPEEFARLEAALAGKTARREVLAAFTMTAADIVADRKAAKKLADYKARELPKEREAIRTEEAAKHLQTTERPDLVRGNGTSTKFDPTKLSDKEFEEFYRKQLLGRV